MAHKITVAQAAFEIDNIIESRSVQNPAQEQDGDPGQMLIRPCHLSKDF